jgi:hypothetical protein
MLEYHTEKEFYVDKSMRGNGLVMCHRSKGQSLVFFFKPDCQHCATAYPHIKRLASEMHNRLQFVMVNLNSHPGLIDMSAQTVHPLEFVPVVVYYHNNRPYAMYDGDIVYDNIRTFATTMCDQIRSHHTRGERVDGSEQRDARFGANNNNVITAPVSSDHEVTDSSGNKLDPKEYGQGTPYNLVKCDKHRCYLSMSALGPGN